jgi:hypothetical protein
METKVDGGKKPRRIFTPGQKFEILKEIEGCKTIKEGLDKRQFGAIGVSQVEAPVGSGSAGVIEKWAAGPVG